MGRESTQTYLYALVCGEDGVACLNKVEYQELLNDEFEPIEWIKAARRPREKYTLSGSDAARPFKIGDNGSPAKIYAGLGDAYRCSHSTREASASPCVYT